MYCREYFGQYGAITEVLQLYHRDTDRKKGVGFITFEDPGNIDAVLARQHKLDGRTIDPKKATHS